MKPEKEKWLLLIILTVIWGSSFILIKKSLVHYSPYQVGALRVLMAGLFLSPLAIKNRKYFPVKRLKWLLLAGISGNFIPMFLFPIAETKVSSSIAGIINSMMPIFVIVIGSLFWKLETTRQQITGILISFFGACLLLLNNDSRTSFEWLAIGLLLIATSLYAVSVTTVKAKLSDIPAKVLSPIIFCYILSIPALLSLTGTGFFSEFTGSNDQIKGLGIVAVLSIFGTGLAMMLHYRLLNISSPLFASTVTLLMPLMAIFWGLLDGESLNALQLLGAFIIIGGLLFSRKMPKRYKIKRGR